MRYPLPLRAQVASPRRSPLDSPPVSAAAPARHKPRLRRRRRTTPGRAGRRRGTVLILSIGLMAAMFCVLALANDLGYLCLMRTRLQRSADSAALAGAATLYPVERTLESQWYYLGPDPEASRHEARRFVRANPATTGPLDVALNLENLDPGDIVVGRLHYPQDLAEPLDPNFDPPNSVRVTIPLAAAHANGAVALFFGRVLGIMESEAKASATATVWYPALLPFATSVSNWESLAAGAAGDNFAYQPGQGSFGLAAGADGLPEVTMFPGPWAGDGLPPGNFGLLQIGAEGGVLEAIRRQIDTGPSAADMDVHGGALAADDPLPGRTGLKSASKHAFLGGWADGRTFGGMLGRPRVLPLYKSVTGNGNNGTYTLDRFVAVRIMAVRIDNRWRTGHEDTEGNEITAVAVQPLGNQNELVQVQLTR